MKRAVVGALLVLAWSPSVAAAQGYRLRLDSRLQVVSYRGLQLDSVPRSAIDSLTRTAEGFAVSCVPGAAFCSFFRPGPERRAAPLVTTADVAVWGLGVPGLSLRASGRVGADLGDANAWPGTAPAGQLLEAYAEYTAERFQVELGRTHVISRFGFVGFDGLRASVRPVSRVTVAAYAGWGLARGVALPVTSPALDPLDDFQPRDRQLVAGADLDVRAGWASGRLLYQREVDPGINAFVSERVGFNLQARPAPGLTLTGGSDWDLANGWMGSAEASVGWTAPARRVGLTLGARRYRPHFPLWTIWGAFSPVPYRAASAMASVRPLETLELTARGEIYEYDQAEAATPLVDVERDGWRWRWHAAWRPLQALALDLGYHAEFGPGAASRGFDAAATWLASERARVTVHAAQLLRPLELRFSTSDIWTLGADGEFRVNDRLRLTGGIVRYDESRNRPDAGAIDWDQFRLSAGVRLLLGSGLDRSTVPPAVLQIPEGTR